MTTIILLAPLLGALIGGFGWRLIGEKVTALQADGAVPIRIALLGSF